MNDKKITLLLVDDHVLFRDGLRELISHWEEFEVVGEAANGEEAIALCQKWLPNIVLMDVQMPVMGGVEAVRQISAQSFVTSVLMLTMSLDEKDLFEAIKQGAKGYMLKNISAVELRQRLHEVVLGEAPLSGEVAAKILKEFNKYQGKQGGVVADALSEMEIQILQLVAQGMTNDEIGKELFLSSQTIKKYLSNILQKLHLHNRVQAAVYAIREGLVD